VGFIAFSSHALTAIAPWSNGSFTFSTLTLIGIKVKTVGSGLTCYWKGGGTGGGIVLAVSNGQAHRGYRQ
jgi:hypothetical protein